MNADSIPEVNNPGRYGRRTFAETREVFEIETEFGKRVVRVLLERGA